MMPVTVIYNRIRRRLRNATGGAALRLLTPWGKRGGENELEHFPALPISEHTPGYQMPEWLDVRQPWLASIQQLYSIPMAWPGSISPQSGVLLHSIVHNVQPKTALELGTHLSISTHWMASALASLGGDRRLYSIDMFDLFDRHPENWCTRRGHASHESFVDEMLRCAELDSAVQLCKGDSSATVLDLAPELKERGGVQLAFIDGDHTEAGAIRDFLAVERVLNRGGYVVLHDIFPSQCGHTGPRFLMDNIESIAQGRYEVCDMYTAPLNYGLGVLRRVE